MTRKGFLAAFLLVTASIILIQIGSSQFFKSIPHSESPTSSHASSETGVAESLVVYATHSFVASDGLGAEIVPRFEKECRCQVKMVAIGDTGQFVTRLELDAKRNRPTADIVMGVDLQSWEFVRRWAADPSDVSQLEGLKAVAPWLFASVGGGFIPFNYGVYSWIADLEQFKGSNFKSFLSLRDFLKPEWKRNLLLEDPRTSGVGLGFLLFSREVLGNSVWDFWSHFRYQWLTLTPGWVGAYGLFMKGEAPLVWSYITSQAYHESREVVAIDPSQSKVNYPGGHRYRALLFEEGQPYQVEGAVLIRKASRTTSQKKLARKFLEYLISREVQEFIPTKMWMMPARNDVQFPESFKNLPQPVKLVPLPTSKEQIQDTLSRWRVAIR